MSNTGVATIDETIQHTMTWVAEVCAEMGDPLRPHGWSALRGVLQHLRDLMGDDEAAHLAAQLPLLIRGLFYEGYDPNPIVVPERDRDSFLAAVQDGIGTDRVDPANAARAVFTVLGRHLDGEAAQVRRRLAAPIRELWPTPPPTRPRRRAGAGATTASPRPPRTRATTRTRTR